MRSRTATPDDARRKGMTPASAPVRGLSTCEDERLSRWSFRGGAALLLGVALPSIILKPMVGYSLYAAWFWERWPLLARGAWTVLAALGITMVLLSRRPASRWRSIALAAVGLGVVLTHVARGFDFVLIWFANGGVGVPANFGIAGLACALVAAGNRIAKVSRNSSKRRLIAPAAGALGLASLFVPIDTPEPPLVGGLLSPEAWGGSLAPLLAGMTLAMIYLASAVVLAFPGSMQRRTLALSALGRIAAVGVVLSLALLTVFDTFDHSPYAPVAQIAGAIKNPLLLTYPGLVVFGLAVVSTLAPRSRSLPTTRLDVVFE